MTFAPSFRPDRDRRHGSRSSNQDLGPRPRAPGRDRDGPRVMRSPYRINPIKPSSWCSDRELNAADPATQLVQFFDIG